VKLSAIESSDVERADNAAFCDLSCVNGSDAIATALSMTCSKSSPKLLIIGFDAQKS
jgi:hypothetical protein